MEFRWLIAITVYTLLVGPIMDVPSSNAKAKARSATSHAVANR